MAFELDRPPTGPARRSVTAADLDADAESFVAFTAALGMMPPRRQAAASRRANDVPSSPDE